MKSVILLGRRRVLWGTVMTACLLSGFIFMIRIRGTIKKVKINIQPSHLSASDRQTVRDAERAAALTIE